MHEHPTQIYPETHWKRHAKAEGISPPLRFSSDARAGSPPAPLETQITPRPMDEVIKEIPLHSTPPSQN